MSAHGKVHIGCQEQCSGDGNLRRAEFLDAQHGKPLSHIDAGVQTGALGKTGEEATSKGIASTSGVTDFLLVDGVDSVLLDLVLALNGNNGRVSALGDDDSSLAIGVDLGQVGKVLGNGRDIVSLEVVRLCVGAGLGLVADDVVPVGSSLVELVLEELGDEGSRKRQHEDLVLLGGLFGQSHDGGNGNGQVVSSDKVDLGLLDKVPVLLEVLDLVAVCGGEVGAHASVMAGDDDTATAGGLLLVDAVHGVEADLLVRLDEVVGVLVLANTANEDDRVLWEDVLGATGRVLSGTTGVQVGLEVGEEVFVETHVLLLGENGIVGLEAILVEQSLVTGELVSACKDCEGCDARNETYPTAWISRRGFSKHKISYFPMLQNDERS